MGEELSQSVSVWVYEVDGAMGSSTTTRKRGAPMSTKLPPIAAAYIQATNNHDAAAFMALVGYSAPEHSYQDSAFEVELCVHRIGVPVISLARRFEFRRI